MIYQKTTDMVQIKKCTFEHITKSYPCKEKSVLDGCMIMRQSIKPEDVQSPFQVEAYALLFCISGEVNIISDLRSYSVTPGTLLSLINISEPTRQAVISYAVFCFKIKTCWKIQTKQEELLWKP